MSELDRSRPFTKAWGIVNDDEPFFFQDGKEFYSNGKEVVKVTSGDAPVAAPELVEVKVPEPEADVPAEEPVVEATVEEPKKRTRKKAKPESLDDVLTNGSDVSDLV